VFSGDDIPLSQGYLEKPKTGTISKTDKIPKQHMKFQVHCPLLVIYNIKTHQSSLVCGIYPRGTTMGFAQSIEETLKREMRGGIHMAAFSRSFGKLFVNFISKFRTDDDVSDFKKFEPAVRQEAETDQLEIMKLVPHQKHLKGWTKDNFQIHLLDTQDFLQCKYALYEDIYENCALKLRDVKPIGMESAYKGLLIRLSEYYKVVKGVYKQDINRNVFLRAMKSAGKVEDEEKQNKRNKEMLDETFPGVPVEKAMKLAPNSAYFSVALQSALSDHSRVLYENGATSVKQNVEIGWLPDDKSLKKTWIPRVLESLELYRDKLDAKATSLKTFYAAEPVLTPRLHELRSLPADFDSALEDLQKNKITKIEDHPYVREHPVQLQEFLARKLILLFEETIKTRKKCIVEEFLQYGSVATPKGSEKKYAALADEDHFKKPAAPKALRRPLSIRRRNPRLRIRGGIVRHFMLVAVFGIFGHQFYQ